MAYLLETPLRSPYPVPKLLLLRTDHPSLDRRQHPGVMKQHCMAVRRSTGHIPSLITDEARDALRRAEGVEDLVDEMRAEIEDAAVARQILDLPRFGRRVWPVTVKVRLELGNIAQRAFGHDFAQSQEIRVPSTVLIDSQQLPAPLRDVRELVGLLGSRHERLFHDHVLARFEGIFAHAVVSFRYARDDHDVHILVVVDFVHGSPAFGSGMVFRSIIVVFRRSLQDPVELEVRG